MTEMTEGLKGAMQNRSRTTYVGAHACGVECLVAPLVHTAIGTTSGLHETYRVVRKN